MNNKLLTIIACALAVAACTDNGNSEPEVVSTQVNIKASLPENMAWTIGDKIAVMSSCSRGDNMGVSMSTNSIACLTAAKADQTSSFKAETEADQLLSQEGDRSFKFLSVYPYSADLADMKSVPFAADTIQTYASNPVANMFFNASATALNVLAPITLNMNTPFAVLEFKMPKNLIDGESSTLTGLTLNARDTSIAKWGTCNVEKSTYTFNGEASTITMTFGEGLALTEKTTSVYMIVAPFTIPEGGLELVASTASGKEATFAVWDDQAGTEVEAGTIKSWTNVITPVAFPVVFQLGKKVLEEGSEATAIFNATYQPRWKTSEKAEGRWIAYEQKDAYAQWHWGPRFEGETLVPYIEIVNSGAISSPGVKGIWSGDYMEFNIPVTGFKAGTTLNISFPFYGRQHPMFWDIEYLDGTEWKCNRDTLYSNNPAVDETELHAEMAGKPIPCYATFISELGSNMISHNFTYTNGLDEGYLKIRLTSVHAEYQNGGSGSTTDFIRKTPWVNGGKYGAPFYFYCADKTDTPDVNEATADLVISVVK